MALHSDLRRARIQILLTTVLVAVLSLLVVYYSYRLERTNEELVALTASLEATTERHALEIARRELERRELDSADREFLEREAERAAQNSAVTAEQYYILGVQEFLAERHDVAQALLTQTLERRPNWADVYLARGRNFSAQGDHFRAIQDLSAGIELLDDPQLYAARCYARMQLEQLNEALEDCSYAVDTEQAAYWVALNYRGFVNYLLNRDDDAVSDWEHAAEYRLQPASKAESLENIGLVYLRQEKWQLALENANRVHDLWSESPWNCLVRRIAAQELGNELVAADAASCWTRFSTPRDRSEIQLYLPETLREEYL